MDKTLASSGSANISFPPISAISPISFFTIIFPDALTQIFLFAHEITYFKDCLFLIDSFP